uniref:Uncharacterized protein n=1 Tax=Sphaerodactylus townsendi TaxID=933632 RepID=A0ACB8FAX3_9SAUR
MAKNCLPPEAPTHGIRYREVLFFIFFSLLHFRAQWLTKGASKIILPSSIRASQQPLCELCDAERELNPPALNLTSWKDSEFDGNGGGFFSSWEKVNSRSSVCPSLNV